MPPRTRSAAQVRLDPVAVLPADVVALVFSLLPVHERLLARGVCRGWRSVLAPKELWAELSFDGDYYTDFELTSDLFLAAVKCAGGELRSLCLSNLTVDAATLLEAVSSNPTSLRHIRLNVVTDTAYNTFETPAMVQLLDAAPGVRHLELSHVVCTPAEAPLLLRRLNCVPAIITIERFCLVTEICRPLDVGALASAASALYDSQQQPNPLFGIDVSRSQSLAIYRTDLSLQMDALVGMALKLRLRILNLTDCELSPTSLPPLTLLLQQCESLDKLFLVGNDGELCAGAAVPAFCAALRASRLKTLELSGWDLFSRDTVPDGLAVLAALTGHPTLQSLSVERNEAHHASLHRVGDALTRLLAHDDCVLETLNVRDCGLFDVGMGRVLLGARCSATLTRLLCSGNNVSDGFLGMMNHDPAFSAKVDFSRLDDDDSDESSSDED